MRASRRSRARWWVVAIALLVLAGATLLWWGLAGPGDPSTRQGTGATSAPPPEAPAPTSPTSTSSSGEAAPDNVAGGGEPTWSTPTSPAQLSAQAAADAVWVRRATDFVAAFARPSSSSAVRQWWPKVQPLMSPQAAQDYAATDPTRVRFTRVTGAGAVLEPDGGVEDEGAVQVGVPTDDGWYLVTFDAAAKVTRIGAVPGPDDSAGPYSGQGRTGP